MKGLIALAVVLVLAHGPEPLRPMEAATNDYRLYGRLAAVWCAGYYCEANIEVTWPVPSAVRVHIQGQCIQQAGETIARGLRLPVKAWIFLGEPDQIGRASTHCYYLVPLK